MVLVILALGDVPTKIGTRWKHCPRKGTSC